MRKIVTTTIIIAILCAAAAAAYTPAEWEAIFVRELFALQHFDLAEERLQELDKLARSDAEKARVYVDIGRSVLDVVEMSEGMALEQQTELLDVAARTFNIAAEADPQATQTVEFRTQLALLKQKRATILVIRAMRSDDPAQKEELFNKAIAGYEEAVAEFADVVRQVNEILNEMFRKPDTPPEQIDQTEWDLTILKLREAIAWYSYVEAFELQPEHPKRVGVVKKVLALLEDVAWLGERSSVAVYAHYYTGMVYKRNTEFDKSVEAFAKVFEEPKEVQVPELMPRVFLEYADALTHAGMHDKAMETIRELRRSRSMIRGYETQTDLVQSTALFAYAHSLYLQNPKLERRWREPHDQALRLCRMVIETSPRWRATAESIVSIWTPKFGGGGEQDATVLMASARMKFREKDYAAAAVEFQKVMAVTGGDKPQRANEAMRTEAAYFLAQSYYESRMYYEAAAVAEWAATRFDTENQKYAKSAFYVGIKALDDLHRATNDAFDRAKYIEFRQKRGEEDFNLFIADELIDRGEYQDAISRLQQITPNSPLYDMALFRIAECHSKMARRQLEEKDAQGIQTLTEAAKRYIGFLEWSKENPPRGDAAVRRQGLEARSLFELGWLLTNRTAENYYRQLVQHNSRNRAQMSAALQRAADALLQPRPEKNPADMAEAEAMLDELVRQRARTYLELSDDFSTRYPDAGQIHPYVLHYRILAAIRFGSSDTAIADINKLETAYPEHGTHVLYGSIANHLDSVARSYEKQGEKEKAASYFNSSLNYFIKLLKDNPEQDFGTYVYVINMVSTRGTQMPAMDKLALIDEFLARFADETGKEEDIDNIRLIQANLYTERSEHDPALEILERLEKKYSQDIQEVQGKRHPLYWRTKAGLAKVRQARGEFAQAAHDYFEIQGNVPVAGETWWDATINAIDCLIDMKNDDPLEDKNTKRQAIQQIQSLALNRPTLGGSDNRARFIGMLEKFKNTEFEQKTQKIVESIKKVTGE